VVVALGIVVLSIALLVIGWMWALFAVLALIGVGDRDSAARRSPISAVGPKVANWGRIERQSTRIDRDIDDGALPTDPRESRFTSGFAG
jgi:hypothetical protein